MLPDTFIDMKASEKKKKHPLLILIPLTVLVILVIALKPIKMIQIISDLKGGNYNAVYVSQFDTSNFDFKSYEKFTLDYIYPVKVSAKSYTEMSEVLLTVIKICKIENVYIGLDFENLHNDKMLKFAISHTLNANYDINIEPVYSGNYEGVLQDTGSATQYRVAANLSDEATKKRTDAITDLVSTYSAYENVKMSWPGWSKALIVNPANFDKSGLLADQTIDYLLDLYRITPENVSLRCSQYTEAIHEIKESAYPDLSDVTVVYISDSIIAKTNPEDSIPALMNLFCHTENIDLSVGGAMCAAGGNQPDNRLRNQIERIPTDKLNSSTNKILVVVNFGLNDFFNSAPAHGDDEYSYEFALKDGIWKIKDMLPGADIFIMSPTFVNSKAGEALSFNGTDVLEDYRDVAKSVAESTDCIYIDNFSELGVNHTNYPEYYVDETHPNQEGRLLYTENLIRHMQDLYGR